MFYYNLYCKETNQTVGLYGEAKLDFFIQLGFIVVNKFSMIEFKKIDKPVLKLFCPVNGLDGEYYGYGTAWKMMYTALENNKVQLNQYENSADSDIFIFCPPQEFQQNIEKIEKIGNQKVIFMFAWECDGLAETWVEAINKYADIVAVSSPFLVNICKKNGIKKPVTAWQHGVNTKFDNYKKREYKKGDDFYFFTYNAGEQRKGWDFVLKAFDEEFGNEHNVKLIAKNNGKTCQSWFDLTLARFNSNKKKDIIRYEEFMSFDGLIDLAHKSHCFLFPALGEGYALPVFEMMLTGLPCILTKAHRFADIPENTFLPVGTELKKGRKLYNVGNWWEPKIEDLKKQMRFVYENYSQASKIGKIGYQYAKEKEDTDIFTKDFLKFLTKNLVKHKK